MKKILILLLFLIPFTVNAQKWETQLQPEGYYSNIYQIDRAAIMFADDNPIISCYSLDCDFLKDKDGFATGIIAFYDGESLIETTASLFLVLDKPQIATLAKNSLCEKIIHHLKEVGSVRIIIMRKHDTFDLLIPQNTALVYKKKSN